ncbi:hypothetical protein JMJ35_005216 [Cladonia borealis]|uniref:Uncharacterized protein n=1 Tax=Cladonia borealis TaxID=184061 RepID=A0AA39QZJ8_9LECA|nr:hypothetical protein JMJ35_005216 [Cladonia borealis]
MSDHIPDPAALHYASIQDAQCQSTLGPDAGVIETSDAQYVCSNDTSLGGTCTSGEKVVRARGLCSKCIALGVRSAAAGGMLSNSDITRAVTLENSLAQQMPLQFNNGTLELSDYQYVCRNDNGRHGRGCYSGEKVSRANQACSKCQLTRKQAERRYEAYSPVSILETAMESDEDVFLPDHE